MSFTNLGIGCVAGYAGSKLSTGEHGLFWNPEPAQFAGEGSL